MTDTLFPECPAPSVPRTYRRGLHVSHVITPPRKSPTGRVTLRFDYTRSESRRHPVTHATVRISEAAWTRVEQIVLAYWESVGGFSKASNALMKAVLDCLLEHGEQRVRLAIKDKAESLTKWKERDHKYRGDATLFFAEKLDGWLDRSARRRDEDAAKQRKIADAKQRAADDKRDDAARMKRESIEHRNDLAKQYVARHAPDSVETVHARQDAHWQTLSEAQQREFVAVAEQRHCATFNAASVAAHHRDAVNRNAKKLALEGASK